MSVHELPNDLQEVYNKLRLSEKDFEVLDEFLEKALIAIENQKKYESVVGKIYDLKDLKLEKLPYSMEYKKCCIDSKKDSL